ATRTLRGCVRFVRRIVRPHGADGERRVVRGVSRAMRDLMARSTRALLLTVAALAIAVPLSSASAQRSQRGQPKTPFALSDLGKLHWLEGTWEGTSPGERTFYERIHFSSDSTVDIAYFMDSTLARQTGSGRVYLSVGRIYHSFGPARWGASHV